MGGWNKTHCVPDEYNVLSSFSRLHLRLLCQSEQHVITFSACIVLPDPPRSVSASGVIHSQVCCRDVAICSLSSLFWAKGWQLNRFSCFFQPHLLLNRKTKPLNLRTQNILKNWYKSSATAVNVVFVFVSCLLPLHTAESLASKTLQSWKYTLEH